jgi:uncharacterized membrane protein YkvA (DUF1232 family)
MLEFLRLGLICGTLLLIAFLILLAMPASRLREIVLPFVGWAVSALSIAFIAMPIDLIPDFIPVVGWADDLVALAIAIGSAVTAFNAGKERKQLK